MQCGEMVFVDSTSNLEQYGLRFFLIVTKDDSGWSLAFPPLHYCILPNSSRGAYLISDPLGGATIRGGAYSRGGAY